MGKLTRRQQRGVLALMQQPTIKAAAKAAGVGERTLHRWLAEDADFQAAVRDARDEAMHRAIRRLAAELPASAETMAAIRDDESNRAAVRLNAAKAIPAVFVDLGQYGDLEQRLAALEAAIEAGGK